MRLHTSALSMLHSVLVKESFVIRTWKNNLQWSRAFTALTLAAATITPQKQLLQQQRERQLQLLQKQYFHCHSSALTSGSGCITITRNISYCGLKKLFNRFFTKMDDPQSAGAYCGLPDRFNGITVDSQEEYEADVNFEEKLKKSLDYWVKHKKRAIWFIVRTQHSYWIPILVENNFEFHHAKEGFVMLKRWLPKDEYANLPDYAHTLLGVGGLVVNLDKMEVLVITDRFAAIPGSWKLPGGYVDPAENLIDAAIREVKEETGVESTFRTMISVRHSHGGSFGCSDLYFVIALTPLTLELRPCEREIARAQWMPIAEYLQHPHVHETNRHFVRTFLDYERRGVRLDCVTATHQILKKKYQLYYERTLDEDEKVRVPSKAELEDKTVADAQK